MLEGRPTQVLADPWGGSATLIEIAPHEVREAWEAARAAFPGRHPVVFCEWGGGAVDPDLLWRSGPPPAEVLAQPAPPWVREDEPAYVDVALEATRAMFGDAPSEQEVRQALGDEPSRSALERWLFEWEEGSPRVDGGADGSHMVWFDPRDLPTFVLVPEAATSEEALAHLDFWALEEGFPPARLAALARSWRERFGAQLVANFSTMLQFVVERPPADAETAWALALEHDELAPDTTTLPGVPLRDHARALIGRDTWFLHQRP